METLKSCEALFKNQLHSSLIFVKFLHDDFSSHLRISKENLGKAQEAFAGREMITVIGPNGKYHIYFKVHQEEIVLEKGWAEFSQAHNLCETDKLAFTCGCHGLFFVLIYDNNGKLIGKHHRSSETKEGGVFSNHIDVEAHFHNKDSSSCNDAGNGEASGFKKPYVKREISDTCDRSDSETNSPEITEIKLRKAFISHRRPVTIAEINDTFRKAQGFKSSRPCFIKQMKRNNVYTFFAFYIPTNFAGANLPDHATKITLEVPGKTEKWEVNCKFRVQKAGMQHIWSINGGWWKFSLANNLEEGDALVFEMMKNRKIKMNVHIFRVVEEIKPLQVL